MVRFDAVHVGGFRSYGPTRFSCEATAEGLVLSDKRGPAAETHWERCGWVRVWPALAREENELVGTVVVEAADRSIIGIGAQGGVIAVGLEAMASADVVTTHLAKVVPTELLNAPSAPQAIPVNWGPQIPVVTTEHVPGAAACTYVGHVAAGVAVSAVAWGEAWSWLLGSAGRRSRSRGAVMARMSSLAMSDLGYAAYNVGADAVVGARLVAPDSADAGAAGDWMIELAAYGTAIRIG